MLEALCELGQEIRTRRLRKRLKQEALADAAGIPVKALALIETGRLPVTEIPALDSPLGKVLEFSPGEIDGFLERAEEERTGRNQVTVWVLSMERSHGGGIRLELLEEHGTLCPDILDFPMETFTGWLEEEAARNETLSRQSGSRSRRKSGTSSID